jgi:hypothetical protein
MSGSDEDKYRLDALIKTDNEKQEAILSCQWDADRLKERLLNAIGRNPDAVSKFIGEPTVISEHDLSTAVNKFSKTRTDACQKR